MAKETIAFESLPPSAQKSYKVTNTVRTVVLFIGLVVTAILLVAFVIASIQEKVDFVTLLKNIFAAFLGGGYLCGIVHGEFAYKFILKKAFSIGFIPIWAVGFIITMFVLLIFGYAGFAFMIVDAVRFFKKIPRVYSFEHSQFLNSEKAQMEMLQDAMSTPTVQIKDDSEVAMENLEKLNGMHEKGLITDEEFETKKAQLLQRI